MQSHQRVRGASERVQFEKLEKFLVDSESNNVCLVLKDVKNQQNAIMHVFFENFSSSYLSGDGVLFYDDGEAHSAEPDDVFEILKIIKF